VEVYRYRMPLSTVAPREPTTRPPDVTRLVANVKDEVVPHGRGRTHAGTKPWNRSPLLEMSPQLGPGPAPTELARLEAHVTETIIAPFFGSQP